MSPDSFLLMSYFGLQLMKLNSILFLLTQLSASNEINCSLFGLVWMLSAFYYQFLINFADATIICERRQLYVVLVKWQTPSNWIMIYLSHCSELPPKPNHHLKIRVWVPALKIKGFLFGAFLCILINVKFSPWCLNVMMKTELKNSFQILKQKPCVSC